MPGGVFVFLKNNRVENQLVANFLANNTFKVLRKLKRRSIFVHHLTIKTH